MVKDYTPTVSILVTPAADMEYHKKLAKNSYLFGTSLCFMMQRYKTNRENVPSIHHILAGGAMLQTWKN